MLSSKEYWKKISKPAQTTHEEREILDSFISGYGFREMFEDGTMIVAGGAPRNWYQNRNCNDIDIFFESPRLEERLLKVPDFDLVESGLMKEVAKKTKAKTKIQKIKAYKDYYLSKDVPEKMAAAVDEVLLDRTMTKKKYVGVGKKGGLSFINCVLQTNYKGIDFQLISLNGNELEKDNIGSVKEFVVKTFDFEICKVIYNPVLKVLELAGESATDFENETLTISTSNLLQYQRIYTLARRAEKIQGYYPDHKIVIKP